MSKVGTGVTDIGLMRPSNEDAIFLSDSEIGALDNLYIVADGMGGHFAGEVASQKSIDFFCAYVKNNTDCTDIMELLKDALRFANENVYNLSIENMEYSGMGTTFTACTIKNDTVYFIHVGDSRIYHINDLRITQISEDHTYVNELIKNGSITPEQAKTHESKNLLMNALGTEPAIEAEIGKFNISKSDKLLICSDGLSNTITNEEIHRVILEKKNSVDITETLIAKGKNNGGNDNLSVIFINEDR